VRAVDADVAVIVLTDAANVKTAIESLQLGAYAFLMKPINVDELLITAARALERRWLLIERRQHQQVQEGDRTTLGRADLAQRDARAAYCEEEYARELHRDLMQCLSQEAADATVTCEGAGVHWECVVRRGERTCSIACFDYPRAEYYLSFENRSQRIGTGRSTSKRDTMAAVTAWVLGSSLEELYEELYKGLYKEYAFVDRQLRDLVAIQNELLVLAPELGQTAPPMLYRGDHCELWLQARERVCKISYYGRNPDPDFSFLWDGCEMFRVQTRDTELFSRLLKRWLHDLAAPTDIKSQHPQIQMSPVAPYYEQGRPVEGEFICSWDWIGEFYREELAHWEWSKHMVELLAQMRRAGFDRTLRAGQSMYTLMLSRSRRHGLRDEQPFISIDISDQGLSVRAFFEEEERFVYREARLTPELDQLLRKLQAEGIS